MHELRGKEKKNYRKNVNSKRFRPILSSVSLANCFSTLTTLGKFSRGQIDIFLIFLRKQSLTACFLGKIRKMFQFFYLIFVDKSVSKVHLLDITVPANNAEKFLLCNFVLNANFIYFDHGAKLSSFFTL